MTVRNLLLTALLLIGTVLPVGAQQMSVEEFKRVRKSLFHKKKQKTDKQMATLVLTTNEKGFDIKANGTAAVQMQQGEGGLTVLVPHKTTFLVIKHPDYGETVWKVPGKPLKRKRSYQAYLHTSSPTKRFRPGKQWLVFEISPENAIVHLDSIQTKVRNGKAQYYLPLGTHKYMVESPFHQAVADSVVLCDSVRSTVSVVLQPFYSYLSVKTPSRDYAIYVDDQLIGVGDATSGHLSPGPHQLTVSSVSSGRVYYYDEAIILGAAEKRSIELSASQLQQPRLIADRQQPIAIPANLTDTRKAAVEQAATQAVAPPAASPQTDVKLIAPSDTTELWLNMERLSVGTWQGRLAQGFYMLTTREGLLESEPIYLWVDGVFPITLSLATPEGDFGMLSVHGNVIDADIYINNVCVGATPCIISKLPTGHDYEVTLRKQGYHPVTCTVRPRGNDLLDVQLNMKKQ